MLKVKHRELEKLIIRAYETSKPLFIWGTTGIGKSWTVRKVAEKLAKRYGRTFIEWNKLSLEEKHNVMEHTEKYFVLVDIRLSQIDPSDLKGLPRLNREHVEWLPPLWLHWASLEKSRGIIFLDELNLAPPSIQASAYQLILDRALGEYSLADGVLVVSAGNRLEDRANVFEMPKPLQNRFLHVELSIPTSDEWITWATENDIDPRIVAFIYRFPSMLFKFEPKSKEPTFPTPRTWHYASDLIKGVNDYDLLEMLVATAVGEATAYEFIKFVKLKEKLPTVEELIRGTKEVPKELDLLYVLSSQIAEWFRNKTLKNKKELEALAEKVLSKMPDEFAMLTLRLMKSANPDLFRQTPKLNAFKPLYRKFVKFIF